MRYCINCNSTKTTIQKGKYEQWYKYQDGQLCGKCHAKLIVNPRRNKIINDKWNLKHLWFKDRIIIVNKNPRKGVCEWCYKEGLTHIHHTQYHHKDPLRHTVELCPSCHGKESWKLGQLTGIGKGRQ